MLVKKLDSERLIIRPFVKSDGESFLEIMRDEVVNTYLPWYPITSLEEACDKLQRKYLDDLGYHYAICLKSDNKAIGYVNVSGNESYDFGYGLCREFWHKGIISEACALVLDDFKDKVPYITATHDIHNVHSGNVLKKIGMQYHYSYVEQWMPKDIQVTFRMFQLNFVEGQDVYRGYWDRYDIILLKIKTDL